MRIGIIGVGAMGGTHAAAWQETEAEIVGFVATSEEHARPLAAQYGAKTYPDLAALLPDIDVVDICTPTHLHHEMVLQAAAAGVDVICEKPLARSLAEGREMIQACQKAGRKLLVGHVVRFFPEYVGAKQAVESGQVGEVGVIRLKRDVFRPRKVVDNWFLAFEKSGGMILDLMIHDFDYARWVAGPVKTVFCKHIGDPETSPGDHGLAILTHENGAISHVEGSWAYPPPTFRTQFEIAGSGGLLTHDSDASAPIATYWHKSDDPSAYDLGRRSGQGAGDVPVPASPLLESPYTTELRAFYDHLLNDTPLPLTAEDALAALEIALAAIESANSGKAVALEEKNRE